MHSYQDYLQAFHRLDSELHLYQHLWQPRPFYNTELCWQSERPDLYQALLELSNERLQQLISNQHLLTSFFKAHLPQACEAISSFKPDTINSHCQLSAFQTVGIPGRKLEQISAFASAMSKAPSDLVDWCSGKGHLARVLHWQHQQPVHCLEFDNALCLSGSQLAQKHQSDVQFYHHDVLKPLPPALKQTDYSHVGLHACGQLHISLLQQASQHAQYIAVAPCCYHKINTEQYTPLSNTANKGQLKLSKDDLHLPQEQTITGGHRIHMLRDKEQLWRLAFDELQKQSSEKNCYLPLPSIPKQYLNQSLSEFCHWAAELKQVPIPQKIDKVSLLRQAEQRLSTIRRLELLRQLFQRPLELWLALDRTLYLFEQGYEAQLQEFCPQHITPRNLLITAQRKAS